MNKAFTILTILAIVADLIELTYDLGRMTRRYVVPAMVYVYCRIEQGYDLLTSQEFTLVLQPVTRPHPVTLM